MVRQYTKIQEIYDKPRKILVGTKTTKSGQVKNVYRIDETAVIIKTITHKMNHRKIK